MTYLLRKGGNATEIPYPRPARTGLDDGRPVPATIWRCGEFALRASIKFSVALHSLLSTNRSWGLGTKLTTLLQ